MSQGRVIKVQCKCGQLLFKYFKYNRGRLIKCYLKEIRQDYTGVIGLPIGSRPRCIGCGKELGVIQIIHGRPALKLNQGSVIQIRT